MVLILVVPRMAGGEATPDGLIAVGQIAKEFGLYTKLTGGQRVEYVWGAQIHELPEISGSSSRRALSQAMLMGNRCVQ